MQKYIFNNVYFKTSFMKGEKIEDKNTTLSDILCCGNYAFSSKRFYRRPFDDEDYLRIKNSLNEPLLLNTEKLITKLIINVNLDLYPNEKYVLYKSLCMYDYKKPYFTLDFFLNNLEEKVKEDTILNILENTQIKINKHFEKAHIFDKKVTNSVKEYRLNLTNLIKYTELKD